MTVAVVLVQEVRLGIEGGGIQGERDLGAVLARGQASLAVVEDEAHVVAHVHVEVAVEVGIGDRDAGPEALVADARLGGDVPEPAPVVQEQPVRAERGHVQIEVGVAVGVEEGGAHAAQGEVEADLGCGLAEASLALVLVERAASLRRAVLAERAAEVDQEQVLVAVLVDVPEGEPGPHVLGKQRAAPGGI